MDFFSKRTSTEEIFNGKLQIFCEACLKIYIFY